MKLFCLSSRVSVSRAIKPFSEPGRPPDWFSQKVKKIYKSACFLCLFLSIWFSYMWNVNLKRELFFYSVILALCFPILRAARSHRSSQVSISEMSHWFDCIFFANFYMWKCCLCSRRKRGEKGEVVETIEDVIVRRLTTERIEELKKLLRDTQDQYRCVHTVLKTTKKLFLPSGKIYVGLLFFSLLTESWRKTLISSRLVTWTHNWRTCAQRSHCTILLFFSLIGTKLGWNE